ncbi:MAG: WXG100 family type VII secretion target [Candidatus Ventricola sp.]
MGVSFLVTLAAIVEYIQKARQAQEKLNEAAEKMNKAAQELCNRWQGDAAQAFAQEQNVLYGYCRELYNVGDEYIAGFEKAHSRYSEADANATAAIKG